MTLGELIDTLPVERVRQYFEEPVMTRSPQGWLLLSGVKFDEDRVVLEWEPFQ